MSSFLLDDLGITRAQLGWVAAGFSIAGALGGPVTGRLTDRFGGRRMLQVLFAMSFLSLIFIASASNYVLLLANAEGVCVDFFGDPSFESELRQSGLYLGADWSEELAGTLSSAWFSGVMDLAATQSGEAIEEIRRLATEADLDG